LVKPVRTRNGSTGSAWRIYGPDQIARLHQILALKRLGLGLAQIGQILAGPDALGSVLALQEEALAKDAARLARALQLVRAARAKLASGRPLSIDDLANLTKETVMAVMEIGDPTSPTAQDLARRWAAFNKQLGGEAPDIRAKGRAVWDDAMNDPLVAAKLALNREIFRFMNRAIDHQKAQAK